MATKIATSAPRGIQMESVSGEHEVGKSTRAARAKYEDVKRSFMSQIAQPNYTGYSGFEADVLQLQRFAVSQGLPVEPTDALVAQAKNAWLANAEKKLEFAARATVDSYQNTVPRSIDGRHYAEVINNLVRLCGYDRELPNGKTLDLENLRNYVRPSALIIARARENKDPAAKELPGRSALMTDLAIGSLMGEVKLPIGSGLFRRGADNKVFEEGLSQLRAEKSAAGTPHQRSDVELRDLKICLRRGLPINDALRAVLRDEAFLEPKVSIWKVGRGQEQEAHRQWALGVNDVVFNSPRLPDVPESVKKSRDELSGQELEDICEYVLRTNAAVKNIADIQRVVHDSPQRAQKILRRDPLGQSPAAHAFEAVKAARAGMKELDDHLLARAFAIAKPFVAPNADAQEFLLKQLAAKPEEIDIETGYSEGSLRCDSYSFAPPRVSLNAFVQLSTDQESLNRFAEARKVAPKGKVHNPQEIAAKVTSRKKAK